MAAGGWTGGVRMEAAQAMVAEGAVRETAAAEVEGRAGREMVVQVGGERDERCSSGFGPSCPH